MTPRIGSIAFRMCLYFVAHPGSVLYSGDIVSRWAACRSSLHSQLATARRDGYIVGTKKKCDDQMYFEAGPALIAAMKEAA